MSHVQEDDRTVEIPCGECDENHVTHFETGMKAMIKHLINQHDYSLEMAQDFCQDWCEAAHTKNREADEAYYDQQKIDRACDRDAFPNK